MVMKDHIADDNIFKSEMKYEYKVAGKLVVEQHPREFYATETSVNF